MRLLELFELQAQEGPCLDAFRSGEPVGQTSLNAGSDRWPQFSAAAVRAGFQSPGRPAGSWPSRILTPRAMPGALSS